MMNKRDFRIFNISRNLQATILNMEIIQIKHKNNALKNLDSIIILIMNS